MQWYLVAALLTVLTSSQGILTTLSQSNGEYKYDYATVPFLAEVFKLAVSSLLLWKECQKSPPPKMTTEWKTVALFPIPSIIYLIHNNVQFATLTYVDTSTYQIMGNLKIVTTGILFRLFLGRRLSNLQWMAIVMLAVGTTTKKKTARQSGLQILNSTDLSSLHVSSRNSLDITMSTRHKGCGEASCDSLFSAPIQGYMLGILSACLSALAGIYTEFLMKKNNDSLYWQNIQLYTFGTIFNMARLLMDDFRGGFENGPWWQRIFNGYTITTWLVVLNLGSTGLLVSWLMKHADNIVKVYSTSMAMLLTMIISLFLFNFKPTLQLFLGIIICMMSLHMYFAPPNMLLDMPVTVKSDEEKLIEVSVDRRPHS
uniref:UDP-sugar transporter protein SLC35A4 n=1 Tax=Cajanus cajan TaxID=3821 RepID=A0A151TY59_CAJCA|nr:putative UDP-sugar transporter protein SLC35A4 [Cajanus cajan]